MMKLKNLISLSGGGTPSKKIKEYWGGKVPWASVKDFKSNLITGTEDSISIEGLHNSAARIVPAGTLLIITRLTSGKAAFTGVDMAFNQDIKAIKCSPSLDQTYLYYFFKSQTNYFKKVASGATVKGIKIGHINNMDIPLPPLKTQKRIAQILDDAAALRDKTQQLLKEYDLLAQSIFLEMFGDPVINSKRWNVKRLIELTTKIHSGNTPTGGSKVYVSEGITFFRSQNIWRNRIKLIDVAYIDEATHNKMKKSSLKHGDILMTKTGRINTEKSSLGRAAMYLGDDDRANVNGHVYLIRPKEGVLNEFILFILTTIQYRDYIRRVCVGGIDKRQINKDHLERFPIIYPSIELQNQFVEKLNLINKQKDLAKQELKESEDLFNCLLQKAFKGELV